MTILNITTETQDLKVNPDMKMQYGEIFTPYALIEKMFSLFPEEVFSSPDKKWLDPGAGTGFFSIFLFQKLFAGLKHLIPDDAQRKKHIIDNMLYMIEIRHENIAKLRTLFGDTAHIYHTDFLGDFLGDIPLPSFHYIIGNPPYNFNGIKKVPTNKIKKKTLDGKTIWFDFIKKSISLLHEKGILLFIVPSLWMKPDKAGAYHYLTQYKIHKLCCLTNTQTNKYFNKEAQTPTCYFTLEKKPTDHHVLLYDTQRNEYINHVVKPNAAIPLFGAAVIQKLIPFINKVGALKVIKTNMPRKSSVFSPEKSSKYPHKNIKTCVLNKLTPELVINYSNIKQAYADQPKLVLAHKMYGFPYLDEKGVLGISNRDNYVIVERNIEDLKILRDFFSTKTALYIFEATRYRMKYLEKYAFEFIPDVTRLADFPKVINDDAIAEFFGFEERDQKNIQEYHKKCYDFSAFL